MRKIAQIRLDDSALKRLMLHAAEDGVYLFGYNILADGNSLWDQWYETVADAEATALEEYGVTSADWQTIPDLLEGCQQDWIAPVRVKGRSEDSPQWSMLERLVAGQWVSLGSEL